MKREFATHLLAAKLIRLPRKAAGVWQVSRLALASKLVHLPHEAAGVRRRRLALKFARAAVDEQTAACRALRPRESDRGRQP